MDTFEPIPVPVTDSFADQLVARFAPWLTPDLETYLRTFASMFDQVVFYAFDNDERPGWTVLFDVDLTPAEALPYLAQYVGERLPVGVSDVVAREWVKDAPNLSRGTPRAVFEATQRRLTGNRLVTMYERNPTVDSVTIVTYTSETPDPAGTEGDILSVLPADVILEYSVADGQLWSDVEAGYATWADLTATGQTWGQLKSDTAGQPTFGRPKPTF